MSALPTIFNEYNYWSVLQTSNNIFNKRNSWFFSRVVKMLVRCSIVVIFCYTVFYCILRIVCLCRRHDHLQSVLPSLLRCHPVLIRSEVFDGIFYITTQYWGFRFWKIHFFLMFSMNLWIQKVLFQFLNYESTIIILYCPRPRFKITRDNVHFLKEM